MEPARCWRWPLVGLVFFFLALCPGARGDGDSRLRSCLKTCERSGCVGSSCLPSCRQPNTTGILEMISSELVHLRWKEWICSTECRYHCMLSKETADAGIKEEAIGYRDNWCLVRVMIHQESSKHLYTLLAKSAFTQGLDLGFINDPASAAFSALNLLGNILGLLAFLKLVYYNLPTRPISRGPYYPFSGLFTIYGVLSTVYWFERCVFHSRNMTFDKHIDSTLEAVLAGYAILLTAVRVGDMRSEQARVVVVAPSVAFLVPHLMYMNLCSHDYGLNMLFCFIVGTLKHLLWITWAGITKHPARLQLFFLAVYAPLSVYLRIYDFSSLWEGLDVESLWLASCIPSTIIFWSFVRNDAKYLTKVILKKRETQTTNQAETKKVK